MAATFVGAENELRKAISEIDHEKVDMKRHFLLNNYADCITWQTNTPVVSHMWGAWERHIYIYTLQDQSFRHL